MRGILTSGWWDVRRSHHAMVAIVAVVAIVSVLFGEHTVFNDGVGWDGTNFRPVAMDPHHAIFEVGMLRYYMQRIAPSLVVHYGLRAAGQPLDTAHIIAGFQVLSVVVLVLSAVMWRAVADALGIGLRARWLGFIGLYVNYAFVRYAFYLPVLTDPSAFAIGMAMTWLYLTRRRVALLAVTLAGAFTWPVTSLGGALLLLFPRRGDATKADERGWDVAISVGIALLCCLGFAYMYFARGIRKTGVGPIVTPIPELIPLTLACTLASVSAAYFFLVRGIGPGWVLRALRTLRPGDVALAALAVLVPSAILSAIAIPDPGGSARGFARAIAYLPNTRPFTNLVAHLVWWGPVVWLVIFHWGRIGALARTLGPGAVAFLGLSLIIAVVPEARQSNLAYPFFIALLAAVVDEEALSRALLAFLAVVAVVMSKFWLRIDTPAVHELVRTNPVMTDADWARVLNNFYLSAGPWMSHRHYLIQGLALAVAGWVIWRLHSGARGALPRALSTAGTPLPARGTVP